MSVNGFKNEAEEQKFWEEFLFGDPTCLILMEKGDDEEKAPVKVVVNRCSNCGKKNRRRNEALKNKKAQQKAKLNKYNPFVPYWDEDKGYVCYPKSSARKKELKKQTSKRARAYNRCIDEESDANVRRDRLLDYDWELC